nr:hypothetical protein [uncultured Kingella sp.]
MWNLGNKMGTGFQAAANVFRKGKARFYNIASLMLIRGFQAALVG